MVARSLSLALIFIAIIKMKKQKMKKKLVKGLCLSKWNMKPKFLHWHELSLLTLSIHAIPKWNIFQMNHFAFIRDFSRRRFISPLFFSFEWRNLFFVWINWSKWLFFFLFKLQTTNHEISAFMLWINAVDPFWERALIYGPRLLVINLD